MVYLILIVVFLLLGVTINEALSLAGFHWGGMAIAWAVFVIALLITKKMGWWGFEIVEPCTDNKVEPDASESSTKT